MGETIQSAVHIPVGRLKLEGELIIPPNSKSIVIFAHGSGSSRLSPRNRHVAKILQEHGIATLLMDLLTTKEEKIDIPTGHLRFDIIFLAERVIAATRWLKKYALTKDLAIGYFGASTGAAAALVAASKIPEYISAIVSRGGRPDLAMGYLRNVRAPTLLIVGGKDLGVIDLNKEAYECLYCEKKMRIVRGASHLFEEPGKLEEAAKIAADWFIEHLDKRNVQYIIA